MSWAETLFLKKVIDGQRTLAPSNSVYAVLRSSTMSITEDKKVVGEFVPNKNGAVRLLFNFHQDSKAVYGAYIYIYENDNETYTSFIQYRNEDEVIGNFDFYYDMPVEEGVKYTIKTASSYNYKPKLNYAKIGASVIDTSFITVLESE